MGVVAVVAIVVAPAASAARHETAAHGAEGGKTISPTTTSGHRVTFGIEPASASGPDGRPNFSIGVTPGGVLSDYAAVVNYSSQPLALQVYATDGVETNAGGFGLLAAGVKPTGVGTWISIPASDQTVHVPAESSTAPGQVVVPFTLHVPTSASPGDHVGGIVASLQTVGTNSSGQSVVLDQRVGSRVIASVVGPVQPALAVTDLHAAYEGTANPVGRGRVEISYVVRNTGNVDLSVTQTASVSELLGSTRTVRQPTISLLLPGASVAEHAVLASEWPEFLLHASVTAIGRPPAGSGAKSVETTSSVSVWAIPWVALAVIVAIVLAIVFGRRRRRRAGAGSGAAGHAASNKVEVGV